MPASWNDQYTFILTHCGANNVFYFLKSKSITLKEITRPVWIISKYLGLSENQTDSSLPSQLPPAAIRGQKSPAGLISLRKCGGNLSIILSLKHPLFFPMASGQLMPFDSLFLVINGECSLLGACPVPPGVAVLYLPFFFLFFFFM